MNLKTEDTIENWSVKGFVGANLKENVLASNCLFVPYEGWRDYSMPVFPKGAAPFFRFLLDSDQDLMPELCIEDADFKELHLHGRIEDIGKIILISSIIPIFNTLFSSYLLKEAFQNKETEIRYEVIVQEGNQSKTIRFQGPSSKAITFFKDSVKAIDWQDDSEKCFVFKEPRLCQ
jgi:hypothetical protein